ncbi:hypothetical protein HYPSUDRAFT_910810 [Hypholoma sublateritium FD-334 SS-4]|uniref:Uncharacterized protein n=1 Tax=Hypholoma sublateritium (strain FD-334 SS-4) TaxID=945553 RepID=A0A0D2M6S1_HYPSF|nr:hypothetical protein HYPSUDRAFT_910810 [Hypholoma sublateritium FD-334 SS-4]
MFLFLEWILNLHYWFTCSSTVGISVVGTKCLIFAILVNYAVEVMKTGHNSGLGLSDWISTALGRPFLYSSTIPVIWMLKTIKRVSISRESSSWIPKLHISRATHTERASDRFDSQTPKIYIVMAYAVLGILLAACNHFDIYTVYLFNSAVGLPSYFLGQSLQIILNFRCKTFSGTYRLGPWFMFFGVILTMVQHIPNLFDHYNIDSGWSFPTFIELLLAGILAGQAATYPPASQQEDSDAE